MPNLDPFVIGYPVNFASGGDTTKNAFYKHIQEIAKIYDHLNALNNDKVSNGEIDITSHINASNPHPNLQLDTLGGTLSASKVSGTLSNANINTSNVNNLSSFVNGLIPSADGVVAQSKAGNGYVKFANDIIIQWGGKQVENTGTDEEFQVKRSGTFPIVFPTECWRVIAGISILPASGGTPSHDADLAAQMLGWDSTTYYYRINIMTNRGTNWGAAYMHYLAIGY